MQPLSGLLVLDFTTLLPGPLATLLLAEAGAEVIKIERPGGEDMRHYEPRFDGESAMFALLNRGKKSLVLDLKRDADRAKLKPLLDRADMLVEQFRPGVMARLGLGYEAVRAINPKLIYCSITGYGQTGPRAGEAGHDLNYIGYTGLLALNPGPPDRPVVPPALIADIAGGTLPAVMNILLALRQRDQTGQGCSSRHRHDRRDVHLRRPRARLGAGDRAVSRHGRRAAVRRLAALSDLSDAGRQVRLLRGAGAEVLGGVHRRDRPRCEIRRRPARSGGDEGRGRGDHRGQDRRRMAAGACRGRLLRHHHGDAGGGACAIRISSGAGCSRTRWRGRRARRCRRCRCRSIRSSVAIRRLPRRSRSSATELTVSGRRRGARRAPACR